MAKQVTFTGHHSGERVRVGDLIEALEYALVWLRGHDPDDTVDWEVVRVRLRPSVSMTFASEAANGQLSRRFNSLNQLQRKRLPPVPPRLTDEDIDGTTKLAGVIGRGFTSMAISSPGEPTVRLTPALVARVEEIARTARHHWYEWTTLRGIIDQITVSPTTRSFRLRHQLDRSEITCDFGPDSLDDVKAALAGRVEVYGRVKFNRADQPKSMTVESIRPLPSVSPAFEKVPAVNITNGMDAAEYVERVRGGQTVR
jgi:hypothetical protein